MKKKIVSTWSRSSCAVSGSEWLCVLLRPTILKGPSLSFFQRCSLSFVTSDIVCSPLQVHLRTNRRGQGCMDGDDLRAKPHGLQSVPSGTLHPCGQHHSNGL